MAKLKELSNLLMKVGFTASLPLLALAAASGPRIGPYFFVAFLVAVGLMVQFIIVDIWTAF